MNAELWTVGAIFLSGVVLGDLLVMIIHYFAGKYWDKKNSKIPNKIINESHLSPEEIEALRTLFRVIKERREKT